MTNVKTCISLPEPLFQDAEVLARQMKVSRSRLYEMALDDYVRRHESRRLLREIDAAYEVGPEPAEETLRRRMRRQHRRIVEGEW